MESVVQHLCIRAGGVKLAAYSVKHPVYPTYSSLQWHYTWGDYVQLVCTDRQARLIMSMVDDFTTDAPYTIIRYGIEVVRFKSEPDKEGNTVMMFYIRDGDAVLGRLSNASLKLFVKFVRETDSQGNRIQ